MVCKAGERREEGRRYVGDVTSCFLLGVFLEVLELQRKRVVQWYKKWHMA